MHICSVQKVLRREALANLLSLVYSTPLLIVHAAMGFGKTVTILDFMEGEQGTHPDARFTYLCFSASATPASAWDRIVTSLGQDVQGNASPAGLDDLQRCLDLLQRASGNHPLILILDDYHNIASPEFNHLIELLVTKQVPNVHLLLISRRLPALALDEFLLKGSAVAINHEDLAFTEQEILQLAQLRGIDLPLQDAKQIAQVSEGWIGAVEQILLEYRAMHTVYVPPAIYRFLQQYELPRYTEHQLWLLAQLSHLSAFDAELACAVSLRSVTPFMLEKLRHDNSFISYDRALGMYRMHPLLRTVLQEHYAELQMQESPVLLSSSELHHRAGLWLLSHKQPIPALSYLLKAKSYDLIMAEFEKRDWNTLLDAHSPFMIELFAAIPAEVKQHHLITWLAFIGFYVTNVDQLASKPMLEEVRAVLSDAPHLPERERKRMYGEMELIEAYGCFNDAEKMAEHFHRAYSLLEGHSSIADKDKIITFGSPHALYLYYREKGKLKSDLHTVAQMFPFYSELAGGCGKGFDDLLYAEYHLELGEFDHAERFAYRSFYKAGLLEQTEVMLCTQLCLARIRMAQGKSREAFELLAHMDHKIDKETYPILMRTSELCHAYLSTTLHTDEELPSWIRTCTIPDHALLYHVRGFLLIVHGKYLLQQKQYIRLEVHCTRMKETFAHFSNQLGFVHASILEAISSYHTTGITAAEGHLFAALDIGFADQLETVFAEYSLDLMDLLLAVKQRFSSSYLHSDAKKAATLSAFNTYLQGLAENVVGYFTILKDIQDDQDVFGMLSSREKEILKLLVEGKTNQAIAERLYLAEVTVRKHITTLYRKLSVRSRAEAVRRALELGLA